VLTTHAALGHDKAQNIIDQITQAYESGGGPPPGGFGFTAASLGAPPPGFGKSRTAGPDFMDIFRSFSAFYSKGFGGGMN